MPSFFKCQPMLDHARATASSVACMAVLWAILGVSLPALAQNSATGSITGSVHDSRSGVPVPGAEISVGGSLSGKTSTDKLGNFTIGSLPPGLYSVSVSKGSYQTVTREDIT